MAGVRVEETTQLTDGTIRGREVASKNVLTANNQVVY
jgi:hypothetical protein